MSNYMLNIKGERFGKLIVIRYSHVDRFRKSYWITHCDCGNEKVIAGSNLKNGHTKSCGCIHREMVSKARVTHRKAGTPIYVVWASMKARCYNPNNQDYKNYGGRGIIVCSRWLNSFENFYADMGGKRKGMTLERENNNLGYSPENCSWCTVKEQANNRRNNKILNYRGISLTIIQWAEKLGINPNTLYGRIRRGWNTQRALTNIF